MSRSRLGAIALLGACAAPYAPYTGDNPAKLRLRLANGIEFSSHGASIEKTRKRDFTDDVKTITYARASMVGSPDPTRGDAAELQLAPGRYLVTLFGAPASQAPRWRSVRRG